MCVAAKGEQFRSPTDLLAACTQNGIPHRRFATRALHRIRKSRPPRQQPEPATDRAGTAAEQRTGGGIELERRELGDRHIAAQTLTLAQALYTMATFIAQVGD